jgi:hypothetical protein
VHELRALAGRAVERTRATLERVRAREQRLGAEHNYGTSQGAVPERLRPELEGLRVQVQQLEERLLHEQVREHLARLGIFIQPHGVYLRTFLRKEVRDGERRSGYIDAAVGGTVAGKGTPFDALILAIRQTRRERAREAQGYPHAFVSEAAEMQLHALARQELRATRARAVRPGAADALSEARRPSAAEQSAFAPSPDRALFRSLGEWFARTTKGWARRAKGAHEPGQAEAARMAGILNELEIQHD